MPSPETEEDSAHEEESAQEDEAIIKVDMSMTTEESEPQPSQCAQLNTTPGVALVKVLGFHSDIVELDRVRFLAKSKPHATPSEVVKHKALAKKL